MISIGSSQNPATVTSGAIEREAYPTGGCLVATNCTIDGLDGGGRHSRFGRTAAVST
jgi:hypothetical protein